MSARVAIIMRTRNRPGLLRRAVDSVVAQTLDDYVLVVVNDAGRREEVDALVEGLDERARARTTVVHNEVSHGREAALGVGLEASSSRYVTVLDDDDTWEPTFLEETVAFLDTHPEHGAVAVRSDIVRERVEEDGTVHHLSQEVLAGSVQRWSLLELLVANYVPTNSQLIRRDLLERIGAWDGRTVTQADWDLNLRVAAASPTGFLPDTVLSHWHHRVDATGDDRNSVSCDAHAHVEDNLSIRDRYLRESLASPGSDLGPYLLAGEYFRRLQAGTQSLEAALAAQSTLLDEQRRELARVRGQLEDLDGRLSEVHRWLDVLGQLSQRQLAILERAHAAAAAPVRVARAATARLRRRS